MRPVRSEACRAHELLTQALWRSPTVEALVVDLEHSDIIVYVEASCWADCRLGHFRFIASRPAVRFVRIVVCAQGDPLVEISWLAHELRHALEVARAPEVQDEHSFRRLYERIGWNSGEWQRGNTFETQAAVETGRKVLAEVRDRALRRARAARAASAVVAARVP